MVFTKKSGAQKEKQSAAKNGKTAKKVISVTKHRKKTRSETTARLKGKTPALTKPSLSDPSSSTAAWTSHATLQFWVPQGTKQRDGVQDKEEELLVDRFDIEGTSNVNELVLRHGTLPVSELKAAHQPRLFKKMHLRTTPASYSGTSSSSNAVSPFHLDRYLSNLVRALVHPLHNFLQCHHGLHNADEVQIMLMPKEGPVAAADQALSQRCTLTPGSSAKTQSASSPARSNVGSGNSTTRRCYVATNNETLTAESLRSATLNWGVAGVFQISDFVLVRGDKGRHAEQKLLEHLQSHILSSSNFDTSGKVLLADEKALVIGERLPCAACRLYAIPYEHVSVMLPSHGHMYLSTIAPSLSALDSSASGMSDTGKQVVRSAYADPSVAAKLLLSSKHRRVLR